MKIHPAKALIVSLCAALPVFASAGETDSDLHKAIQARKDLFAAYYNADDAASIAAMYTVDATMIAPNYPPSKGRDEIQLGLEEELALGDGIIDVKTQEVERISETTVSEIGFYTLRIDLDEGDPIIDEGHYIVIWKLSEEGEWQLHLDIWNTSLPLE